MNGYVKLEIIESQKEDHSISSFKQVLPARCTVPLDPKDLQLLEENKV